jgi:AraC family transcriptional regulator, melibiose operon regulatory protein
MDELTVLPDQSEILHYDDPDFPLYLRRNKLSLYPMKRVLCHWHTELEFFLVEKGHPSYFVNGSNLALQEGECLFVNAKYPHYGYSSDGTDSVYLVLVFRPSLLSACPEVANSFLDPLLEDPELPFLLLPANQTSSLRQEMLAIFDLMQKKEEGYPLRVLSHLYSFYGDFLALRGKEKALPSLPSAKSEMLKRMLTFIYSHYGEKITLEDIASSGEISSGYASHLFKDLLQSSPIRYLLSFRIEKSEELLRDRRANINEVAQAVGFESAAYFTEIFKREKGMSPREYRKHLLEEK